MWINILILWKEYKSFWLYHSSKIMGMVKYCLKKEVMLKRTVYWKKVSQTTFSPVVSFILQLTTKDLLSPIDFHRGFGTLWSSLNVLDYFFSVTMLKHFDIYQGLGLELSWLFPATLDCNDILLHQSIYYM